MLFPDGDKLKFGTSGDLEIFHDSGNSFSGIKDTGTGPLAILTSQLLIQNAAGSANLIKATDGGAAELLHSNATKLATESGGVNVTGYMDADNFKVNGAQGSDGQVLTSTGSGVGWEAVAAGGKHSLVSSTTLSSAASSITCTGITGDFDTYVFRLFGISTGDSLAVRFNFTDDSGNLDTQSLYDTQILQFQSSYQQKHYAVNQSYAGAVNAADGFSVMSVSSQHSGQIIEGFLGTPHTYDSGQPTGRMIHAEDGTFIRTMSFTHRDIDANFGGICITGVPNNAGATFATGSYLQLWSVAKS